MTAPTARDLIRRGTRQHGHRNAFHFGGQDVSVTVADRRSNRLAHALAAKGAGHHARVAILLDNGLHSIPLDFACVKGGINRVPLNGRLSEDEHARMLENTGCEILVHGAEHAARAEALAARRAGLTLLSVDDLLAMDVAETEPDVPVQPDDIILTLFTSGTTGTLKAAQHTQASYAAICRNLMLNLIDIRPGDVMMHAASLIHASGVFVIPYWLRGGTSVILPGFDPATYLADLKRHRATAINLVPTMLQMLLQQDAFQDEYPDLRQLIYGASPMPRPVIEAAMAAWGREKFWQYYGQTECPLCLAVLRPEDHDGDRLSACGQPAIDMAIRLIDEQGNDVAEGEPGEIAVRGPSMMAGYHDAPDLNAEMFTSDGWLRTRDIGQFDADGFLHLRDRTSDMIVTGGYNVYPREVEDALMAHPAVSECAVIGLPDDKWVEAVTATVVLSDEVSDEELIAFVGERLAGYKKPRHILRIEAVPKTAIGKIDRKALRARLG